MEFPRLLGVVITAGLAVVTLTFLACQERRSPGGQSAPAGDDAGRRTRTSLQGPLPDPRIVITKGERRLRLCSGEDEVRTYRIGLGFSPVGDKEREGDGRTPEGEFYVCVKNPRSRFFLSLGLSYPNKEDAQRGLSNGLTSQAEHDRIVRAINGGDIPPWNTDLGGEVFIHGRGSHRDWTLGCIALDDDDLRELYEVVDVGTAVTIQP